MYDYLWLSELQFLVFRQDKSPRQTRAGDVADTIDEQGYTYNKAILQSFWSGSIALILHSPTNPPALSIPSWRWLTFTPYDCWFVSE